MARSVQLVTERAAKALSDTVTPAGVVAVCEHPNTVLADVLARNPRLVAVGVEIGEPGNAGTLIRIADAMGAAAVVFIGHSVDPYNGKCLRASAGSIFALPVVVAPDVDAALTALRGAGLQVLATTVDGEASLDEADLARADGMAVRFRGPRVVGGDRRAGRQSGEHSDVGRRPEFECGCGCGDLPLPKRQGAARLGPITG